MKVMCPNLMKGWLFASGDVTLIEAVLMKLECEIFQTGDIIIQRNGPADRMFFIERGRVHKEIKSFQQELLSGEYFGGGVWETCFNSVWTLQRHTSYHFYQELPTFDRKLVVCVKEFRHNSDNLENDRKTFKCAIGIFKRKYTYSIYCTASLLFMLTYCRSTCFHHLMEKCRTL